MIDLNAIKTRCKTIIEGDLSYMKVFLIPPSFDELDDSCPAVVLGVGAFNALLVSGIEGRHDIPIEHYVYIQRVGEGLTTTNNFDLDGILQELTNTYMTRPRLQFNDNGLNYVQGDISFAPAVRSTAQLITYPINFQAGNLYWGFQSRLTVPYRLTYLMSE